MKSSGITGWFNGNKYTAKRYNLHVCITNVRYKTKRYSVVLATQLNIAFSVHFKI